MTTKPGRASTWVILAFGGLIVLSVALGARGLHDARLPAAQAGAKVDIQQVYLDQCSTCHGEDGRGHTAKGRKEHVKDLHSAAVQKHTDLQLLQFIEKGKGKNMDGFLSKLGPQECKQLVNYVRELGKK